MGQNYGVEKMNELEKVSLRQS